MTLELAHLMGSSPSRARDALASFLESCCTEPVFCNDLLMNHRIETCFQTGEEQRDAVLRHVLNGLCVLQPDIVSCKFFGRGHASTIHLSYEVCALLLREVSFAQRELAFTERGIDRVIPSPVPRLR